MLARKQGGPSPLVILNRIENARRTRGLDLAHVVDVFVRDLAAIDHFHTESLAGVYFEVGSALSVVECARSLQLDGALYNQETGHRTLSPNQIDYVGGLIRGVPDALRAVCARVAELEAERGK